MQRSERVDAVGERFVSLAGGLEPVAHGVAADEACAGLLARELLEKFLLITNPGNGSSQAHKALDLAYAQGRKESSENDLLGGF